MITSKTVLAAKLITVLDCAGVRSASAAIIVINPSKDNTLYEYDFTEGDQQQCPWIALLLGYELDERTSDGACSHSTLRETFRPAQRSQRGQPQHECVESAC
jgi:hypothetical protein